MERQTGWPTGPVSVKLASLKLSFELKRQKYRASTGTGTLIDEREEQSDKLVSVMGVNISKYRYTIMEKVMMYQEFSSNFLTFFREYFSTRK